MDIVPKATRVFSRRFQIKCKDEQLAVVFMDLYKLPEGAPDLFPEGYKFSWIAFDPDHEDHRVLLDCHPPKGPHINIDGDADGETFDWITLEAAYEFFFAKIKELFGEFTMEEDDL